MFDNCCGGAFVLGFLMPMILCLLVYLGLALYVIYYVYQFRSIDLRQGRKLKMNLVNQEYQRQLRELEERIKTLGS